MFREFIYRLPLGVKGGFAPLDYLIINPYNRIEYI